MIKDNKNNPQSSFFVYTRQKYNAFRDGIVKKHITSFEYKPELNHNNLAKNVLPGVLKIDSTTAMLKIHTCLALFAKVSFTEYKIISGLRPVKVVNDEWLFGDVMDWKAEVKSLFIHYPLDEDTMAFEVFYNFYPSPGNLYTFLYQHLVNADTVGQVQELSKLILQKENDRN